MTELRVDYISGFFCITPIFQAHREPFCIFCPGNEEKTPPAELIFQHKKFGLVKTMDTPDYREKNWSIRVIRHVDPILTKEGEVKYSPEPFSSEPARGMHYAIITGQDHDKALHDLSPNQISEALIATQETIKKVLSSKGIPYATALADVIPNEKTYLGHPHLEVIGFPALPPFIKNETSLVKTIFEETGSCPYCRIVAAEKNGPRQILATNYYISIVPWSPKHDYEVWILPLKHQRSFLRLTQKEIRDLSLILKTTLKAFYGTTGGPYSFVLHIGPERRSNYQFHWYIQVFPSRGRFSALEKGLGVKVLELLPEKIADQLSRKARKEIANLVGVK